MGKLIIFDFISLNGFFKGPGGDISWNLNGDEEILFSEEWLRQGAVLLFGRITYQLMENYWQTADAAISDPIITREMNKAQKFVISKTLDKVDWPGTTLLKGNLVDEVIKLKQSDKDIVILGSGSVINQLADAGLIDLYRFMIFPILIPDGTPIFSGTAQNIGLKFVASRILKSGTVVLEYEPV